LSPLEVLKERARQLGKVLYSVAESWKERMPKKNEENDLEHELSYCGKLEKELNQMKYCDYCPRLRRN
jgi:hypothetical protein